MSQFITITVSFLVGAICAFASIGIFIAWQIHKIVTESETNSDIKQVE